MEVFSQNSNVPIEIETIGISYANLGAPYRQSGFQFKSFDDDNWNDVIDKPEEEHDEFYKYFKIADVGECKRVSRRGRCREPFGRNRPSCCINKETGVNDSQVHSVLAALPDWSAEAQRFLSGPNKLVFVALACKKTNLEECTGSDEHRVIRMDTNKVVKVY